MGGIYELCRFVEFRFQDMHTKFHEDWFRYSNVTGRGFTGTETG
jgi:hypothetical protein